MENVSRLHILYTPYSKLNVELIQLDPHQTPNINKKALGTLQLAHRPFPPLFLMTQTA
jgi:hypothetical protein